ncbi:MAG: hypothetical protein GY790_09385 [Bacteroidetes bacterium]|nr:hypothetical protein [Bacteroidota bacterium]
MNKLIIALALFSLFILGCKTKNTDLPFKDNYNIQWDSQSKNSSESMPCGGGDIGLNVWVENGEVFFYMQRSGSLAEQNEYLKLGRVRLKLDPNPFAESAVSFRQELKLHEGFVEIQGSTNNEAGTPPDVILKIWVEVTRPIIHVEVDSDKEIRVVAQYENWRQEEEILPNDSRRHSCITLRHYPGEVTLGKDSVAHTGEGVLFYHRNPGEGGLLPGQLIRQQGLEAYRDEIADDLCNRTFGGMMTGSGFQAAGKSEGIYQTRAFRAWGLRSKSPSRSHHLRIVTHIDQSETIEAWRKDLQSRVQASEHDLVQARDSSLAWWDAFWNRSYIVIHPEDPDTSHRAWRIARNYNLFRYQLGCNAFGEYPSKFNGGNYTFDANLVGDNWEAFGPDWRQWGGGVFTAQNQRLLYWPMLKSGDVDAILPQFELYRKALPGARARVRANFGHDGAIYSEYIGVPGLAAGTAYGWESGTGVRSHELPFGDPQIDGLYIEGKPVETGVMDSRSTAYHWESQIEHAYMILEYRRFTGADISKYIPFIENAVVFFDQHYRKREKMRSGKELDEKGQLVIFPSKSCESFRAACNPTDVIAGLQACVDEILTLDDDALSLRDKKFYQSLRETIPPYAYAGADEESPQPLLKDLVSSTDANTTYARPGVRTILPARSWKEYGNGELPMLYPLFPFNRFALWKDDMQVFRDTYKYGNFRKGNMVSWHQDGIFFARMGQTELAADFTSRKLDDSQRRFPTFWGPGHDWVPDHNWGGSGMIGLQEMLLQTIGDKIHVLPAWPEEWDVDFKLHAPKNTTVEVSYKDGEIVSLIVSPESRMKDVVNMN